MNVSNVNLTFSWLRGNARPVQLINVQYVKHYINVRPVLNIISSTVSKNANIVPSKIAISVCWSVPCPIRLSNVTSARRDTNGTKNITTVRPK